LTRILDETTVERLLPPALEAIELARQTLIDLARGRTQLPPKPTLHPRPASFVNVMPAHLREPDLTAVKVVAGYPGNREAGLPAVSAVVLMLDSATGVLTGLLAGAALTAARTAAASGACMQRLAPARAGHLALTGAGVEARSHLRVAAALGVREAAVWDHRAGNIERLRAWASAAVPQITLRAAADAASAADGAAVVVTGIPIGARGGEVPPGALARDALVLPLDYSTSIGAEVANEATLLATDDLRQFETFAAQGHFAGWRTPDGAVGDWLADSGPPRQAGRVVVANLGVGAHDAAFAHAVLTAAEAENAGTLVTL